MYLWDFIGIVTLAAVAACPWVVVAWRAERPKANKAFVGPWDMETIEQ